MKLIIFELAVFVSALVIFIISAKEMWIEKILPEIKNMKSKVVRWFKGTSLGMWYSNYKNGVRVISAKEYHRLVVEKKVSKIIYV